MEMSLCTSREFSVTVSPATLAFNNLHYVWDRVREANVMVQVVSSATRTRRPNQGRASTSAKGMLSYLITSFLFSSFNLP